MLHSSAVYSGARVAISVEIIRIQSARPQEVENVNDHICAVSGYLFSKIWLIFENISLIYFEKESLS